MNIFQSIVSFFVKGGHFMIPILVVGALALAIVIERYITLTRLIITNRRIWNAVEPSLRRSENENTGRPVAISKPLISLSTASALGS